jgi:hypothetical protein
LYLNVLTLISMSLLKPKYVCLWKKVTESDYWFSVICEMCVVCCNVDGQQCHMILCAVWNTQHGFHEVLEVHFYPIKIILATRTSDNISYKLPSDCLSLFRRSVNRWRVSAPGRILQLFTYRLNNHSRSWGLITFLYDVADL